MSDKITEDLVQKYNNTIPKLTPREAVRQRPGMYFFGTDDIGYYEAIHYFFLGGLFDIAQVKNSRQVKICCYADGSFAAIEYTDGLKTVNGQLPTQFINQPSTAEKRGYMTDFNCVCYASQWMTVTCWQEDGYYEMRFEEGELVQPPTRIGEGEKRGSHIHFLLDPTIFTQATGQIPFFQLSGRLRYLAACCPGLKIELWSEVEGLQFFFHYPHGIQDFLTEMTSGQRTGRKEVVYLQDENGLERVEIALTWLDCRLEEPQLTLLINGERNFLHGTPIAGLYRGLTQVLQAELPKHAFLQDEQITLGTVNNGLMAVLNIWTQHEKYSDNVRMKFANEEIGQWVDQIVQQQLPPILNEKPGLAYLACTCACLFCK